VLPFRQKLTLGLLTTITLKVVPLCVRACTFATASAIFKCILEVVFCEGDSASITSVLSSIGETEKSGVGRGDSHIVFGQKFPGEKGIVRRHFVVMQ
jgi:hypothetical protein